MNAPVISQPQPGFYRLRRVRGGPWIAARIWIDNSIPERPAVMLAEIDGQFQDPLAIWPSCAGNDVDEAEYRHLLNVREWAVQHAPNAPEANPLQPIDLATQPVFTPRRTA